MRVVGLISGGKDSCYNMMQCIAAGHEIVALANIQPVEKDELDSYMYQTVGHQGIEMIAEAMELPLFRQSTKGKALEKGRIYNKTENDEVEDLYELLETVKKNIQIEGVAVGAILSDYQRVRVENVCNRSGLVSLAYLWRRDQVELLQEMIDCQVNAIVIKVAALGLDPTILGKPLWALQSLLLNAKDKFGLNVCGEGGEYETFTLDCPLFKKKIVVDETQVIIQSNDSIAPVGYINLLKLHLEPKTNNKTTNYNVKGPLDFINDINKSVFDICTKFNESMLEENEQSEKDDHPESVEKTEYNSICVCIENVAIENNDDIQPDTVDNDVKNFRNNTIEDCSSICANKSGWHWIGGVTGEGGPDVAMENALYKLCNLLSSRDLSLEDVCSITLYIKDMGQYNTLNQSYIKVINFTNPPSRVCVECPLPEDIGVILEASAFKCIDEDAAEQPLEKYTMHVQGISHWAPANIGPYSQAVRIGEIINIAGQIPLVPGTMKLIEGNGSSQCRLALRHVQRILNAVDSKVQIRDVVQAICYVTHPCLILEARHQWEEHTNNAIVDFFVVPKLPRDSPIEWHVWAHRHNSRFEYEETGCSVGEYKVALTRRWNYENNVSAVVCFIATATSPSTTQLAHHSEDSIQKHKLLATLITVDEIADVLKYAIRKLFGDNSINDDTAMCLRISYKVNRSPDIKLIFQALKLLKAESYKNMVFTVIPVLYLQNAFTFLSISAIRHEA